MIVGAGGRQTQQPSRRVVCFVQRDVRRQKGNMEGDGGWRREDAGQYSERGSLGRGRDTSLSARTGAYLCRSSCVQEEVWRMLASSPQDEARGVESVGVSGWDPRRGSGGTYLLEKLHVLLSLYFHGTRRSDQQHEAADNSHLRDE